MAVPEDIWFLCQPPVPGGWFLEVLRLVYVLLKQGLEALRLTQSQGSLYEMGTVLEDAKHCIRWLPEDILLLSFAAY